MPTKVRLVKAMVFPVVMYECESWTVKKAERRKIDAFELWCWRRLLRVSWTARRSNQSILKEISLECSLEGLRLKLNLQYFGHLMWRVDSLEKTLMLGGWAEGERYDRGWDGWMASPTRWPWVWVNSGSWWWTGRPGVLQFMGLQSWTWPSEWTEVNPCSSAIAPSPPRHVTSDSSENKNKSLDRGHLEATSLSKFTHQEGRFLTLRAEHCQLALCPAGLATRTFSEKQDQHQKTPQKNKNKPQWKDTDWHGFYSEIIQPDYVTVKSRIQQDLAHRLSK